MASTDGAAVLHDEVRELTIGRQRGLLSTRILLVAAVSVLTATAIALAVAFPLVKGEAQAQARAVLSNQADTLAGLFVNDDLHRPGFGGGQGILGGGDRDRDEAPAHEQVVVFVVNALTLPTNPLKQSDIDSVNTGADLSLVRTSGDFTYFIEGRALSPGEGLLLIQRDIRADLSASTLLSRLVVALVAGLAISLLVAWLVARRTAKPLREAAEAAALLAEGRRDVDVEVSGPREVADIAHGLNKLSLALANSEDRQRDFLLSVSHELRTPLTSIRGYGEAMADGVLGVDDLQSAGSVILAEGERLDRLVSDLLDLARSDAVDFRLNTVQSDLVVVVTQAADSWRLRCEREGLEFRAELPSYPVIREIDPTRFRQIIDNLVENSVRVTPTGGVIAISLRETENGAELVIEDSGPGLAEEDLNVAFEPGVLNGRYQKERQVGTGVGLALVGRLASRLGAQAIAGHGEFGGAKFQVRFPQT